MIEMGESFVMLKLFQYSFNDKITFEISKFGKFNVLN